MFYAFIGKVVSRTAPQEQRLKNGALGGYVYTFLCLFVITVRSKNSGTLAAQTAIVHRVFPPESGLRGVHASGSMFIIPLNSKTPIMLPIAIVIRRAMRRLLSGLHKRKSIMKPINITAITDIVDISTIGISRFLYSVKIAVSAKKLVSPAGMAFLNTLTRNFPRTILLLGSIAKMNDGMPMIIMLYSVNCIPSKGNSD